MGTLSKKKRENRGLSTARVRGKYNRPKKHNTIRVLSDQRRVLGVDEGKETAFPPSFVLQKGEFIILRRVLLCSDEDLTGVEAHARPQETALLGALLCGGAGGSEGEWGQCQREWRWDGGDGGNVRGGGGNI